MPDTAPRRTVSVTRLTSTPDMLGETPVWDNAANCLWWIDGAGGKVRRMSFNGDKAGDPESFALPGHVGSIALAVDGCLVAALDRSIVLFQPGDPLRLTLLDLGPPQTPLRLNDGKTDRQGRFLVADISLDRQPVGQLHRIGQGRAHEVLVEGITVGNGLCFSPDGATMYYSDSALRKLMACDYDPATGACGAPRVHIDTADIGSGIDGATVDSDGNIWGALIHSARIGCFSSSGRLIDSFAAPVDLPASLAFGGPGMDRLFVTSIRDSGTGKAVSKHPDGGHLFVIDGLGATGIPEARFG
ncbi:transcriptional regulator [Oceanicola sp. 22II-s10i]|uniref:SMP-30/gluconolactonase/LRE family protein n=1 Tax=Oceanicola sp. 22II-s10i TaxID=1317116 RepID=UPI000B523C34|nr:SMP-30/gluconolactonase/LRE family protein [Oceanicola sp. 22II-s10i]OWU84508.1 transcriptional regulator [Oceanicola sp. 22II-s10i]